MFVLILLSSSHSCHYLHFLTNIKLGLLCRLILYRRKTLPRKEMRHLLAHLSCFLFIKGVKFQSTLNTRWLIYQKIFLYFHYQLVINISKSCHRQVGIAANCKNIRMRCLQVPMLRNDLVGCLKKIWVQYLKT